MEPAYIIYPLIIGFALDSLLGDPRWMPHPVRLFGWSINKLEPAFNKGKHKKLKGALMSFILIGVVWCYLFVLIHLVGTSSLGYMIFAPVGVFYGLANRSLIDESWHVIKALNSEGLEAGRRQLSFIVGRETSQLSEQQVRTAVLETMAENLSDGVIAPLFYYALGGIPMLFVFKMVSTLDSMVGYKNERFKDFGWFAARLDDVLNFIPARLTALLMVLVSVSWSGLEHVFKYGRQHASPNAGYPEAALAGILKCRFGGPNVYHGQLVEKPFIGHNEKHIENHDFWVAAIINSASTVLMIALIVLGYHLLFS